MGKNFNKGIVYVAFGYEYLLMAFHSAETAKKYNPEIICSLITNISFDNNNNEEHRSPFDSIKVVSKSTDLNREVKTNFIEYTNFERGLFLDCDTEVLGSLEPIFKALDKFDVAIKMHTKTPKEDYMIDNNIPGYLFPVWNSGVIFFKNNDKSKSLFKKWNEFFCQSKKNKDQPSLAKAIYFSPQLKLLTLNASWNTFPEDIKLMKKGLEDSRIWHYRRTQDWPEVAPKLLKLHNKFSPLVKNDMNEKLSVQRRLRFLSNPVILFFIKNSLIRSGIVRLEKLLLNLKIIKRPFISREDKTSGNSYNKR